MSELTKKRVHWTEYNGDELLHDEDVDVLTSADAVTFDDGEDLQYKYTKGQFVNPSVTGSLSSLSTTNKSSLVDAINEVKTNATSNELSIGSLTERISITETDIDNLEARMDTTEADIDNLENRVTPITLGGTGATNVIDALGNLQIYTSVEQLGLAYPCTTTSIFKAMPNKSMFTVNVESMSSSVTDVPVSWGMLKIIKINSSRRELDFIRSMGSDCDRYVGGYDSSEDKVTWHSVRRNGHIIPISDGGTGASTESNAVSNLKTALVDLIYPVGSIHMSVNSKNPSTYFGGTWVSWGAGRVPVGVNTSDSSFSTVEKTGGAKTHTLTVNEIPSHTHTNNEHLVKWGYGANASHCKIDVYAGTTENNQVYFLENVATKSTGGNAAHNNLQPYITCYMWKRTE